MARTGATAVSAVLLALALTGVGASPFVGQNATASAISYDPDTVQPCDAGQECPPETTITVTTTPPTPSSEQEAPETTITKTVTATSKTKAPSTPQATKTTKAPEPAPVTQSSAPQPQPQPLPTQSVEVPSISATSEETDVVLAPVTGTETPTSPPPTEGQSAESDEIPLEMRNAAPEFDQRSLTQQLSIPALILVLLVLFAVLIFEGRLRRMAHAAAIRKAGPLAGHPGPHTGYPAGPGYATAAMPAPGYPGGTAYAPIISFVPVQTYPGGPVQYGAIYQDPNAYTQPGYAAEQPPAQSEPVVLQPDQFDSFSHQPAPEPEVYRSPFEPVIPPTAPPADIPPGGAKPYEDSPDRPLPAASAAEPGDSEPWTGGLPLPGQGPMPSRMPDETVVQPLPTQPSAPDETTVAEPLPPGGKRKRGLGRRRK